MAIFLTGFMGAGKSTLLTACANRHEFSEYSFLESDHKILSETQSNTIPELFNNLGEDFFRQKEVELIKKYVIRSFVVIALGGGSLTDETFNIIKKSDSIVIFLDTPFEICLERIKNDPNRPLAAKGHSNLIKMYNDRLMVYNRADYKLNYAQQNPDELIKILVQKRIS